MKKLLAFLTALIMVCFLSACGNESTGSESAISDSAVENDGEASGLDSSVTEKSENEVSSKTQNKNSKSSSTGVTSTSAAHKHSYKGVKTPATCKQKGYTTYTCSCGDSYVGDYVNGTHTYENNKCKYCGKMNIDGLYTSLKSWVLEKGTVNGDYISYTKSSDTYGGYDWEDFSLTYWNDTEELEFCLHSPLDDTYSHNFFIYIPKKYDGNYKYISSYYYRDTGSSKYESKGVIEAGKFTENYPLKSTSYYGAAIKCF